MEFDNVVTQADAEEAIKDLDNILKERARQLAAVRTLYGTGIMEHTTVIRYTKLIEHWK